jgi:hypothetical protein
MSIEISVFVVNSVNNDFKIIFIYICIAFGWSNIYNIDVDHKILTPYFAVSGEKQTAFGGHNQQTAAHNIPIGECAIGESTLVCARCQIFAIFVHCERAGNVAHKFATRSKWKVGDTQTNEDTVGNEMREFLREFSVKYVNTLNNRNKVT